MLELRSMEVMLNDYTWKYQNAEKIDIANSDSTLMVLVGWSKSLNLNLYYCCNVNDFDC